jgi:3-oxoacyl-[acyl-carrier protein] reductase
VVEERFDTAGDVFDLAELDKTVGSFFADRDPSVCFAADSVMQLKV